MDAFETFTWSQTHQSKQKGGSAWETELGCAERRDIHAAYQLDFNVLATLGFNFSTSLCVEDGGTALVSVPLPAPQPPGPQPNSPARKTPRANAKAAKSRAPKTPKSQGRRQGA